MKFGDKVKAINNVGDEGSIFQRPKKTDKISVSIGDILYYVATGKVKGKKRIVLYSEIQNQIVFPTEKVFKSCYKLIK